MQDCKQGRPTRATAPGITISWASNAGSYYIGENDKVSENASIRQFPYPVLAYVTPWNSMGYQMAKEFNSKVTHISPVWYDLKSQGANFVLEGRHNVDKGWISDLRMKGRDVFVYGG